MGQGIREMSEPPWAGVDFADLTEADKLDMEAFKNNFILAWQKFNKDLEDLNE